MSATSVQPGTVTTGTKATAGGEVQNTSVYKPPDVKTDKPRKTEWYVWVILVLGISQLVMWVVIFLTKGKI